MMRLVSRLVFLNEALNEGAIGCGNSLFQVAYASMTKSPFPGFDGLMTLSRREGVDIRPTLLRVLTDLYVHASSHSEDEQRQFVELATRLIDQVDDATRAAVKARLAIYPSTPAPIMQKLGLTAARGGPQGSAGAGDSHTACPRPRPAPRTHRGRAAHGLEHGDAAEGRGRDP
ncbi:hypothetical protein ACVWXO_010107 [Bradyrhizobium sp. LM2.7]